MPKPSAAVYLASAGDSGLIVEYEVPTDDEVHLESALKVRGVASCDLIRAGDAERRGERRGERPEGRFERRVTVRPGYWVPLSPERSVAPTLSFKVSEAAYAVVIDEEAHQARLLVERQSDWLVGWTPRANVHDAPPLRRASAPKVRSHSTTVTGNSLEGMIVCPHDLPVVAEVGGVRRTVGLIRGQATAIRKDPGLPTGTETLLDLEGSLGLKGTEHGDLFLQHEDMDRCTCRPGDAGVTRSRP